jgi:hypothetical protein
VKFPRHGGGLATQTPEVAVMNGVVLIYRHRNQNNSKYLEGGGFYTCTPTANSPDKYPGYIVRTLLGNTYIWYMKVIKVVDEPLTYGFVCPGCKRHHHIPVQGPHPVWGFNGDIDSPTFTPSINSYYEGPGGVPMKICHSFVKAGYIQFLGDCYHELKNQTIPLPEVNPDTYY